MQADDKEILITLSGGPQLHADGHRCPTEGLGATGSLALTQDDDLRVSSSLSGAMMSRSMRAASPGLASRQAATAAW